MKVIDYSEFKKQYDILPNEYQQIIFSLLQDMEHTDNIDSRQINYSRGLKIAMAEHDFTVDQLADSVKERTSLPPNSLLRDSIASIVQRGYKSSSYLEEILNILDINETFLIRESEYIHSNISSIEWCFNTLSNQNKEAVYWLVSRLTDINGMKEFLEYFKKTTTISNIGVEPIS